MKEKCFACDRRLGNKPMTVATSDGQRVLVGSDCLRRIVDAGADGYQPPKGGPKLFALMHAPAPTKATPAPRPYSGQCTRVRRWFVRKGTLNMTTGETAFDVEPGEWVEGACGTPLFGDRPAVGICKGCERGWFVATNYPIGSDPRVKTAPVVVLTEQGARNRVVGIEPRTALPVDHFSQVLPDGQLMAHVIDAGGNRWSLGAGDYAIRPDVARECKVMEDPGTPGLWVIIWDGQLCSPTFNSEGAADICLGMYRDGVRKPELRKEAAR